MNACRRKKWRLDETVKQLIRFWGVVLKLKVKLWPLFLDGWGQVSEVTRVYQPHGLGGGAHLEIPQFCFHSLATLFIYIIIYYRHTNIFK